MSSRRYAGRRALRDASTSAMWRCWLVVALAVTSAAAAVPDGRRRFAVTAVLVAAVAIGLAALRRRRVQAVSPWLLLMLSRCAAVVLPAVALPALSASPGPRLSGAGSATAALLGTGLTGSRGALAMLFLLPYPLLAVMTAVLVGRGRPRPFWAQVTHAAMGAVAVVAAAWCVVVLPLARIGWLPLLYPGIALVYAVLDVVTLVGAARQVFARSVRGVAAVPVFGAALLNVLADVLWYDPTGYRNGPAAQAAVGAWLMAAVLLAGACLHPALRVWRLERSVEEHDDAPDARLGRYVVVTLAVSATPLACALLLPTRSATVVAVGAGCALAGTFAALVVARFARSVTAGRQRAEALHRRVEELLGQARGLDEHASALDSALQEHREQQKALEFKATHDQLTQLANRALLIQHVELALDQVGRHSGMAMMLLDLDGFKGINDTLGHLVGDDLLRAVAERLTEIVPSQHTVARLGGDEFAVLAVGVRQADEATALAEEIVAAISQPYVLGEQEISVTVSIGVRHLPRFRAEPVSDLMRHADMAMYTAKRGGRNGAALYGVEPAAAPVVVPHRLSPAAAQS